MRRSQHTLKATEVQHLASQLLRPLLGTWPRLRSCTCDVVIAILTYAASRISSITDACLRLANAPDSDIVLARLAQQLVDRDTLDHRLQVLLRASLPRSLRRGQWIIAIDTTLIPYHGLPFADESEIFRSQPKHGTTHFHCYATAFVIRDGLRFTLAILPVDQGIPMKEVVRTLRRRVVAMGIKPKLLLLDRGFNNAGVVRYLQSARQPFITPQAVHGKKPKNGVLTGLRAIRAHHRTGWTSYSWKPNSTGERRVSVALCVLRRSRIDRRGHRTFLYACWGVRRSPSDVYRIYRLRFGVETSYRQMNQVRIRTSTRNPSLRLLFVVVALLLRNLWAWLHWAVLAEPRRGGRRVRLQRLRLRAMANWLLHLAEQRFGWLDQTIADHPPDQPLVTRLRLTP
jgi:putative transposase